MIHATFREIHDFWNKIQPGDPVPDFGLPILNATREALAQGLFYSRDIDKYVCEKFKLSNDLQEEGHHAVEGGRVGMEIYHARRYLDATAELEANRQAAPDFPLGRELKNLRINGQNFSTLTVKETGSTLKLEARKRGSPRIYEITIGAAALAKIVKQ